MSLPPPSKHDNVGPTSANDVGPTPRRIDPTSARCRANEQMTSIRRHSDANYRYVVDVLLTSARRRRVYWADGISIKQQQQPFNGLFSRTTWVSRYQKGKTNLDFTGARDSEWHFNQSRLFYSVQPCARYAKLANAENSRETTTTTTTTRPV